MFSTIYDMSRGLVNQKQFSRKKRKQSIRKKLNRSGIEIPEIKISPKIKNILSRGTLFIILIIWGIYFLIKSSFFKPEQRIAQVKFSESTIATYQDIELFNFITEEVKWKNYFILSSNKDELLEKIQKNFPFVWKLEFQLESKENAWETHKNEESDNIIIWIHLPHELPISSWYQKIEATFPLKLSKAEDEIWWTLWIQLSYIEPSILVKLNDKKFAVRNENLFTELQPWMLLSTTKIDPKWEDTIDNLKEIFTIETPWYISWTNSLSWFFFEISLEKFLEISKLAQESFPNMKRFVYLAGSTRIAIFDEDDKTLYFNFPSWEPISNLWNSQIEKYNKLKNNYQKFDKIEKIDLWALEENKTIIMNY